MAGNKPTKELSDDERTFIDLPGRRSHEYFPQLSSDGHWLVWAATQRGHDHDIVDYEIYLWQVGHPAEEATRLTFHSGNDRWPDIFIPGAAAAVATTAEEGKDKEDVAAEKAPAAASGTGAGATLAKASTTTPAKAKAKAKAKKRAKKSRR
jgi:hypothetical protein